jgi:hypothetical protein
VAAVGTRRRRSHAREGGGGGGHDQEPRHRKETREHADGADCERGVLAIPTEGEERDGGSESRMARLLEGLFIQY